MVFRLLFIYDQAKISDHGDVTVDASVAPDNSTFAPRAGLFCKVLVHSPHLINSPSFTEVIDIVCVIVCVPFLSTALDCESLAVATTPGT